MNYKNNTFKEVSNIIKETSIRTRSELRDRFPGLYRKFCFLSEEEKEALLPSPKRPGIYSNLKSVSDFKTFVKNHKITSRKQFQKLYEGAYNKFLKLTKEERNEILPVDFPDYSVLNTKESFIKFIDKYKIISRKDFNSRFDKGYLRFKKLLTKEEQDEILPTRRIYTDNINTVDDFIKFINDHKINNKFEFQHKYTGVYNKYKKFSKEIQEIIFPSNKPDYSDLNTLEDFKIFIKNNNIISKNDFSTRFYAAFEKFRNLIKNNSFEESELKDIEFLIKKNISYGEMFLENLLKTNGFIFEQEKQFFGLVGKKLPLRFDFYLPEYNLLIEYHGRQHFDKLTLYSSEEQFENDRKKFEFAKNNNINIIYFTLNKKIYEEYGYFAEVITDPDILINKIREVGMTNQSSAVN